MHILSCICIVSLIITAGCSGVDDQTDASPHSFLPNRISGRILDKAGIPVPGVEVTWETDKGNDRTLTDLEGRYYFENIEVNIYTIDASKPGYTHGRTTAQVSVDCASVPDIVIKHIAGLPARIERSVDAAEIKKSGLTLHKKLTGAFVPGDAASMDAFGSIAVSIPPGAKVSTNGAPFTGFMDIVLTHLAIDDIPPSSNSIPLGAAFFEPVDAQFSESVTITLPLGIKLLPGFNVPLKKYANGIWIKHGFATTDKSGETAYAQVKEFGLYAVFPEIALAVDTREPDIQESFIKKLPVTQNTVHITAGDSLVFPSGIAPGIASEYAYSLLERMKKTNVSESKYVTFQFPGIINPDKPLEKSSQGKEDLSEVTCSVYRIERTTREQLTITMYLRSNSFTTSYTSVLDYIFKDQKFKTECTQQWASQK